MPYQRLLSGLALLVLLSGCGNEGPHLSPLAADAVILAFGDSLTFGVGAESSESYPAQLEHLTGHTVINAGISGETSAQGRQRLSSVLQKKQPTLVLLCLGGNDFLQRLPGTQTKANLAAMIEMIQQRDVALMLLYVPAFRQGITPPPLYQELADHYHLPTAPDIISQLERRPRLKSDMIHPNAKGYRKLAERLTERLHHYGAL